MFQFCGIGIRGFRSSEKGECPGVGILDIKRQGKRYSDAYRGTIYAWESLRELSSDVGKDSPYLFPFLKGIKVGKEAYKEYTSALAHFNRNLKRLARAAVCLSRSPHIRSVILLR